MTPYDLVIVYHIHVVWTLTTGMWSMMLVMSLVSQNDVSPLCTENTVAINTSTVTRNVMKLLSIMSRMFYFNMHSYMHIG